MMRHHSNIALIVAGGRGSRAGEGLPKQYRQLGGMTVLRRTILAFLDHAEIEAVRVVIHPDDETLYRDAVDGLDVLPPIHGGETRMRSVMNGLNAVKWDAWGGFVLVHDAARTFVSAALISRCVAKYCALEESEKYPFGVVPALRVVDSLRRGDRKLTAAVDRADLLRMQTPQCFNILDLETAIEHATEHYTDEAAVALAGQFNVFTVEGDEANVKLTTPADFARAEAMLAGRMISRTAMGFDVHRFGPGDHLWLCGVRVPHTHGLIGHSDADVGLHALTDALLGCIGAGDIGTHFPPSDEQWRGASSDRFLAHACSLVAARGGVIDHLDLTIIAERPKVGPHRAAFAARIAEITGCASVSIKATTTEGLGFTGRGEGIAAHGVASIRVPA